MEVPVETPCLEGGAACCCVTKDGGDDVDATHGLPICARVEAIAGEGILLQGGSGVGRVTRPGLGQPEGEWAINHIPRQMIREAVDAVRRELDEPGGLCVTIFVPGGEEAARKTFNPHLGIEGGISILGTSGIVEPMSVKAIVETTALELRQAAASGARRMVLTPGNYGMEFLARGGVALPAGVPVVRCSNFIGEALDGAGAEGFSSVLLVGHIGKLVKLAGGIMNTHSRWADGRAELFCAHAALCGADRDTARALYKAFSWNPGYREFFAVKATPNPQILKILKEEGCGTDCSSLTELMMSDRCGFAGQEIMFSSNATPAEEFALAANLFKMAVELKNETGCHITFINLSGGVGVPYLPDQPANDIAVIGEGVRRAYEDILVPAGMGDVSLCTELGRFMLAPNGHLVTRVLHEKQTYKDYIGVDACAANLMRPAMYGAYHHITVMGKEDQPCDHQYDVTGALCENNDKFAVDRMLPKIDIGDLLVIHDTGAHGHAMGYQYNGRLRSAEVLLQADGSTRLIRRAETPEDYFATAIWD